MSMAGKISWDESGKQLTGRKFISGPWPEYRTLEKMMVEVYGYRNPAWKDHSEYLKGPDGTIEFIAHESESYVDEAERERFLTLDGYGFDVRISQESAYKKDALEFGLKRKSREELDRMVEDIELLISRLEIEFSNLKYGFKANRVPYAERDRGTYEEDIGRHKRRRTILKMK